MKTGNEVEAVKGKDKDEKGPKYIVVIEGKEYPWDRDTITAAEIARLGGWELSQGVIEIDKDNVERTLRPDEVIELKPGHGFSKKVVWKRGDNAAQDRISEELALLKGFYSNVQYFPDGQWVIIRNFPVPEGWNRTVTDIAFQIPTGYPGAHPYGFYVPSGLQYQGKAPGNYKDQADNQPPFEDAWGFFSWSPDSGEWRPTTSLVSGSNLLNVVRTFGDRLREGA